MENKKDNYNEEIKKSNKKNNSRDFRESIKLTYLTSKNEVNIIIDKKSEIINLDKIKIGEKIKEKKKMIKYIKCLKFQKIK